mmetsp:Transcript_47804/g.76117  ORF Transcript_47804/g.76117 Transcript_47804/m.76117 type:complete len:494 (+) Transcript_47804:21-1502(+)
MEPVLKIAKIRVVYVNGDFAELNRRLGQELAHDVFAFRSILANLPAMLQMAERKQLMGPSLGMEAQVHLSAVSEEPETHPEEDVETPTGEDWPDTMQSEEGKAVLREVKERVRNLESRLSEAQNFLHDVCKGMNEKGATSTPAWANGAHVFVTQAVANSRELKEELENYKTSRGKPVGKGCVLVSDEYFAMVKKALDTKTQGTRPRKFKLEEQESILIGPIKIDTFRQGPSSLATRETKTTGDIPQGHLERDCRVWNGKTSLGPGTHKRHLLHEADVALQAEEASEVCCEEESSGGEPESRSDGRPVDYRQLMKSWVESNSEKTLKKMDLESDLADFCGGAEHADLDCLNSLNEKFKTVIQALLKKSLKKSLKSRNARKKMIQRKLEEKPIPEESFAVGEGTHAVAKEFRSKALLFIKELVIQDQKVEKKSGSSNSRGSTSEAVAPASHSSKGKGLPKKVMRAKQNFKSGMFWSRPRQQPSSASRSKANTVQK